MYQKLTPAWVFICTGIQTDWNTCVREICTKSIL